MRRASGSFLLALLLTANLSLLPSASAAPASAENTATATLLVRPADDPNLGPTGLTKPLEAALGAMLPALLSRLGPVPDSLLETPIEVRLEPDYVEQGQRTGEIGSAVLFKGRLHLVDHPDDRDLVRVELARLLLRRAKVDLPETLEDGAALWLAERWYGRRYDAWLDDLVFADVLPTADELLAKERPGDGSSVLWPPIAAAVLDRLPGETLLDKLDLVTWHLAEPQNPLTASASATAIATAIAPAVARGLDAIDASKVKPEAKTQATTEIRLARSHDIPFQRGVSFAMANGLDVGYHAPGVDEQLTRLHQMGADAVSLMPFAYQPRPDQPRLGFLNRSPGSETDVGLVNAARRARKHGFYVLWKPHLWVSHASWPGDIAMTSEADWQAWWRSYRRYVVHHALLARFAGAEMLCVGVELGRTVEREADWRHLIAAVRRIFPGQLTYAGNWWGDYDRVTFWDALDVIGVDAYFPLAETADATDAQLRAGAERTVHHLAEAAQRFARPVLLTEVGFAARNGAWVAPHEEGGALSNEDQRRAWAALLGALGKPSWLRGLYAWKVFSHPRAEKATRPDFRFLERPAATELERWFKQTPTVTTAQ